MSKPETKRAVAYVRVSSLSQVDGHSLDAQARLFNEICANRGWVPVNVYREEGASAHSESIKKRPMFRQLMEDAKKGAFDIVVVHTLDRWSRNLRVTLESLANLAMHDVALVSITEDIDYSTPQGMLMTQLLGSFAQFFSNMLGTHVSKGLDQRATLGLHTGGIPFGYQSCWVKEHGERRQTCENEHPGGIHHVPSEAAAIKEMFERYAAGTTTLNQLAAWLNEEGFRTRNTRKMSNPDGSITQGPRLFTNASVRVILHNPFYAGLVKHRGELYPGAHEPVVSIEMFDVVQDKLRQNSGRSMTLTARPERQYLLKGIIRCAYCLMPMWSQTYKSGGRYYREHRGSRGHAICPASGGSIRCEVADQQVGKIVEAIELGPRWEEEVLSIVSTRDEAESIRDKRQKVQERLRRLGKAYVDGVYDDEEYKRQKRTAELELGSLVLPEADAAAEAGKLISELQKLWSGANLQERRKLLMKMLDAVYVDSSENTIVAIKPKAPFKPVFGVVRTRDGSEVVLVHDLDARPRTADQPPPNGTVAPDGLEADDDPCLWWRRGRAYLHLEHELRLAGLEIDGGVGIVGSGGRGQGRGKGRHSRLPLRQVVRIGVPSVEGRQLRRHFDALRRMRV